MKRAKFDPGFERRKLQRRHDVVSNLQEKACEFCSSVAIALASPDMAAEGIHDPLCRDLVLVAALGGLQGVECLQVASALVPNEYMAERSTHIATIVNSILPAEKQVNAGQLKTLSSLLSASSYVKHPIPSQSYLSSLRQASEITGVAHTAF